MRYVETTILDNTGQEKVKKISRLPLEEGNTLVLLEDMNFRIEKIYLIFKCLLNYCLLI